MPLTTLPTYSQLDLAIEPPEYSSRAQHGVPTLTDVSQEGLMFAQSTSNDEYLYRSRHMLLNLGPRWWKTTLPSYGRGGIIQGFLDITNPKGVRNVTVILEGFAKTSVHEDKPGGLCMKLPKLNIINEGTTLFTSSSESPSSTLRIPLVIPIAVRRDHAPTCSIHQGGLNIEVTYRLRIDMARRGWSRSEKLLVQIAYLPKSAPRSFIHRMPPLPTSFDWKNRSIHDTLEYKSFKFAKGIHQGTDAECSDLDVHLLLPQPLEYTLRDPIPFKLAINTFALAHYIPFSIPVTGISPEQSMDQSHLLSNLSVELFKVFSIGTLDRTVQKEILVGRGEVSQVYTDARSDGLIVQLARVQGLIQGTSEGEETSWAVPRGPRCTYEIRATLKIPKSGSAYNPRSDLSYFCTAPVVLRTHLREELMALYTTTTEATDPALGLLRG